MNSEELEKLNNLASAWREARKNHLDAQAKLDAAAKAESIAANAFAGFVVPYDARDREAFQFWTPKGVLTIVVSSAHNREFSVYWRDEKGEQ